MTKDETGCRPDQLFGLWAIEETRFRRMVELVKATDLDKLRAESRAASDQLAARPLYTTTADRIARIDLSGPMTKYPTSFQALLGGTSMLRMREALRAAVRDPEVLGIMVVIDSPGGTVAGTADLAADIRQANRKKPVYTYAEDLAGSGALWALTQGRKAFGNATAEIGSLGAYMVVEDTSGQAAKADVKVHVIRTASFKGAGVDGTEITPAQLAEWERRAKDLAAVFVDEVGNGRGMGTERAQALHTGQMWVAGKAKELGLIDDVVSLEEAMRRLRSEAMSEQDLKTAQAAAAAAEAKATEEAAARAKAEQELATAKAQLGALEAEKRTARFAAEAETVGAPKEFAKVLDGLEAKAGPELYGALTTQLKAFKAQVDAGALFTEKGSGAPPAGGISAADQVKALAAQYVKEGKAKTVEAATVLVAREKPELYKQHVQETRKGGN